MFLAKISNRNNGKIQYELLETKDDIQNLITNTLHGMYDVGWAELDNHKDTPPSKWVTFVTGGKVNSTMTDDEAKYLRHNDIVKHYSNGMLYTVVSVRPDGRLIQVKHKSDRYGNEYWFSPNMVEPTNFRRNWLGMMVKR